MNSNSSLPQPTPQPTQVSKCQVQHFQNRGLVCRGLTFEVQQGPNSSKYDSWSCIYPAQVFPGDVDEIKDWVELRSYHVAIMVKTNHMSRLYSYNDQKKKKAKKSPVKNPIGKKSKRGQSKKGQEEEDENYIDISYFVIGYDKKKQEASIRSIDKWFYLIMRRERTSLDLHVEIGKERDHNECKTHTKKGILCKNIKYNIGAKEFVSLLSARVCTTSTMIPSQLEHIVHLIPLSSELDDEKTKKNKKDGVMEDEEDEDSFEYVIRLQERMKNKVSPVSSSSSSSSSDKSTLPSVSSPPNPRLFVDEERIKSSIEQNYEQKRLVTYDPLIQQYKQVDNLTYARLLLSAPCVNGFCLEYVNHFFPSIE